MIEDIPVLRQRVHNLEGVEQSKHEGHIADFLDFFKDLDLIIDEVLKEFHIPKTTPTLLNFKP